MPTETQKERMGMGTHRADLTTIHFTRPHRKHIHIDKRREMGIRVDLDEHTFTMGTN